MYSNTNYRLLNSGRASLLTCILSFSLRQSCEVDIISFFQDRLWIDLLKVTQWVSWESQASNPSLFSKPISPPSLRLYFLQSNWVLCRAVECLDSSCDFHCPLNAFTGLTRPCYDQIFSRLANFTCFPVLILYSPVIRNFHFLSVLHFVSTPSVLFHWPGTFFLPISG